MGKEENNIIKEVSLFKKKIKDKYKIKKMYIFGSVAKGKFKKNSDIDIIIVSDKFKNKKSYDRSPSLYLDWNLDYPVDFLCYTTKEFKIKKNKINIVSEALKESIEI